MTDPSTMSHVHTSTCYNLPSKLTITGDNGAGTWNEISHGTYKKGKQSLSNKSSPMTEMFFTNLYLSE